MKQQSFFNFHVDGFGKSHIDANYPETAGFKENTTSKEMAEKVELNAKLLRDKVLYLYSNGFKGTADDACFELFGNDIEMKFSIRPRISELLKQGKLKRTGQIKDGKNILEVAK